MQLSELLLTILGSSDEPIAGRTAIQKITYFASLKTRTDGGFGPHYYGPFSSGVAGLIEELSAAGFIAEQAKRTVNDRVMYSYFLTDDGRRLFERLRNKEPQIYEIVRRVVKRCKNIANNNIGVLSWSAKIYFLITQKGAKLTYSEARQMSKKFGWQLPENELKTGVRLLKALGLVRVAND